MHLPRGTLPVALLAEAPPAEAGRAPALQRIRARGVLRVAFVGDRVPFAFVNARGDLVGMDVELAQRARARPGRDAGRLRPGGPSTRSPGCWPKAASTWRWACRYLPELLTQVAYSLPYLDSTLGLVVRDELRDEFATRPPAWQALAG